MSCCIGLGKVKNALWYLLLAALFRSLNHLIYGLKDQDGDGEISFYAHGSILKDHKLLQSIIKFFGITVLSFLYFKIENQEIKKTTLKTDLNNEEISDSIVSKNENSKFLLIYNEVEIDNEKYISQILFIGFMLGFVELMDQFYYLAAPKGTDYWIFEIFFTAIFIKRIFKIKLYRHQIFSVFFIVILCSIMKILSFLEIKKSPINLVDILFISYYLLICFIRSYVYTKIKWFMDIRYISNSKILFIYGLFGFFTSLIICILANTVRYFKTTYGNYSFQSNLINWWEFIVEIILIIVYMCLNFLAKYYYIQILKIFSPIHVIITNSLYYFFIELVSNIYELFHFFDDKVNKDGKIRLIFTIVFSLFINIFSLFGYLVYVELIEIKCCGLNYNLKKNIIIRSKIDSFGNVGLDERTSQSFNRVATIDTDGGENQGQISSSSESSEIL